MPGQHYDGKIDENDPDFIKWFESKRTRDRRATSSHRPHLYVSPTALQEDNVMLDDPSEDYHTIISDSFTCFKLPLLTYPEPSLGVLKKYEDDVDEPELLRTTRASMKRISQSEQYESIQQPELEAWPGFNPNGLCMTCRAIVSASNPVDMVLSHRVTPRENFVCGLHSRLPTSWMEHPKWYSEIAIVDWPLPLNDGGYWVRARFNRDGAKIIMDGKGNVTEVQPIVVTKFKSSMAVAWMDKCKCYNKLDDNRNRRLKFPRSFRLIDVDERKLVVPPSSAIPEYVTLSYMWEKDHEAPDSTWKTVKSNYDSLTLPGGLSNLEFTPMIQEVFEMCRELKIRYFWMDRICIIQDDEDDKKCQILEMSTIYTQSMLTICLAQQDNLHESVMSAMTVDDPRPHPDVGHMAWNIKQSLWNNRGWTFQEAQLPTRALFIQNGIGFWRCDCGLITSEHWDDNGVVAFFPNSRMGVHAPALSLAVKHRSGNSMTDYYRIIIEDFCRRNFRYWSDSYYAWMGVEKHAAELGILFHHGIPESRFVNHLCWSRDRGESGFDKRFPSWSWGSFDDGGVLAFYNISELTLAVPVWVSSGKWLRQSDYDTEHVLDVPTMYVGDDDFLMSLGPYLVIEAPTLPMYWLMGLQTEYPDIAKQILDVPIEPDDICIFVLRKPNLISGLILRATPDIKKMHNGYHVVQRVGSIHLVEMLWYFWDWDWSETRKVIIV